MLLPELFHHQSRFIGALGLRRLSRSRDASTSELSFPLADGSDLALFTHAIDYSSLQACPARLANGYCSIHTDRKPLACTVVPLDAWLPDTQQHRVLAARSKDGSEYLGSDCIISGTPSSFTQQTEGSLVVDEQARTVLADHRQALRQERQAWGEAVFTTLINDPAYEPGKLSANGMVCLPLAPVLLAIARHSPHLQQACRDYLAAQISLINASISQALARKHPADRAFTARLRDFAGVSRRLIEALETHASPPPSPSAAWLEAWLGDTTTSIRQHSP